MYIKLYHWFGRFESGQRSDGEVWMMESVSNVRIMNTAHSHYHITHLTAVSTVQVIKILMQRYTVMAYNLC